MEVRATLYYMLWFNNLWGNMNMTDGSYDTSRCPLFHVVYLAGYSHGSFIPKLAIHPLSRKVTDKIGRKSFEFLKSCCALPLSQSSGGHKTPSVILCLVKALSNADQSESSWQHQTGSRKPSKQPLRLGAEMCGSPRLWEKKGQH